MGLYGSDLMIQGTKTCTFSCTQAKRTAANTLFIKHLRQSLAERRGFEPLKRF